jgi:type IV pilus assembly protein PilW
MTDTPHLSASPCCQRGLTLVELLVSITIGLVLMLAIISAYIGSAGASAVTQAQARMNEDAQAALLVLSQHVRMAGYNPKQPQYAAAGPYVPPAGTADTARNPVFDATNWAIRGCDGTFTNIASAADLSSLTCGTSGSASLAVRYEADANNTVKNSTGQPTDCLGQALPSSTGQVNVWDTATSAVKADTKTFTVAESRFYVGTTTVVISPSLYCKGNGGAAQPLVENVEDMKISYGVAPSTATTTLTVAGYLSASSLATVVTTPAFASVQDRWSKVATVRICLIVRSEQAVAPSADSARYNDCDGVTVTNPPDLRLRRAYSTTIVLRNRVAT